MRQRIPFSTGFILLGLGTLPLARSEEIAADLDPARTNIGFVLSDVLHTVHGNFRLKQGHFEFDPSTGGITGDMVVDAASGNSGNGPRDRRMTRDVLQAQRYPEIRFSPKSLSGNLFASGPAKIEVSGSFSIHGQPHELSIPLEIQMSPEQVTGSGIFVIPYVAWGMKDPSNFLLKVNDKVEIDLNFTARISHPASAGK
ncbi:MAG: YceI family protein [Acidobacteriaceae bacterium]|nr:YceI family protein [Acidobacteriaceae bacterium]